MASCSDATMSTLISSGFSQAQADALCQSVVADISSAMTTAIWNSVFPVSEGLNCLYLVLCAALVFIMHAGFAMLCAGAIRSKNTMNILLQTILDAVVSALAFYVLGYGIAYGGYTPYVTNPAPVYRSPPNGFMGTALFGLADFSSNNPNNGVDLSGAPVSTHWQDFVFQWAFAATATTIPAGAVAERFNFNAYLGYSFFVAAWVYPIVVHWVWSQYGWLGYARLQLAHLFRSGMIDFAGSGVVHMVGGICGMWGCILVGPRMGRFDSNGKPVDMPGHSATLVVLGTVLLWFGWYGFNPGSMISISTVNYATVVGRAAVTTTLAGAGGGLSALFSTFFRHKAWDLLAVCNGVLCGFVAVTAGCHVLEPWAAIIDGALAAIIFDLVCMMFLKLKIDDPLWAAPMHGFCGMWGVFFVGLLAKQEYIYQAYAGTHTDSCNNETAAAGWNPAVGYSQSGQGGPLGPCYYNGELYQNDTLYNPATNSYDACPNSCSSSTLDQGAYDTISNYPYGLFYIGGGGRLLASQVIGILVIFGWVSVNMIPFFYIFKMFGMLRISAEEEQAGLDVSKHGGSAYNYDHGLNKPEKAPGL